MLIAKYRSGQGESFVKIGVMRDNQAEMTAEVDRGTENICDTFFRKSDVYS